MSDWQFRQSFRFGVINIYEDDICVISYKDKDGCINTNVEGRISRIDSFYRNIVLDCSAQFLSKSEIIRVENIIDIAVIKEG